MHDDVEDLPVYEFRRGGCRVLTDMMAAPIGAILFLGMAFLSAIGALGIRGWDGRIVVTIVFGFFGLLMAAGAAAGMRRGSDPVVLTIGPRGMWTPEMGQLRWSEIGEVRLERVRGASGEGVADYMKLGIVPKDPARAARVRRSLAYQLGAGYLRFVRQGRPDIGVQEPDALAPFGVFAYEMSEPMDDVIHAVRQFSDLTMPDGRVLQRY